MQDSQNIVTTLDLTGLKCPLPVLKARRAVKAMADKGETGVIAVLADDPAAPLDFQHFCDVSGLVLLRNDAEGGVFTLHIDVRADSLQGS
ncbi:MAG: sulfurtransferase TusA family protein [Candidatus Puniceispirillaceae bacterium]